MTRDVDAGAVPNLDTLVDKFADEYQHRPMYACKDMLRDFAVAVEAALRSPQPQAVKVPDLSGIIEDGVSDLEAGRSFKSTLEAFATAVINEYRYALSAPTAAPQAPEGA